MRLLKLFCDELFRNRERERETSFPFSKGRTQEGKFFFVFVCFKNPKLSPQNSFSFFSFLFGVDKKEGNFEGRTSLSLSLSLELLLVLF